MQLSVGAQSHCTPGQIRIRHYRCVRTSVSAPDAPSTSGRILDYAPTREPKGPGFLKSEEDDSIPWVRPAPVTITPASVRDTGTLRPAAEWYPAWMKYRGRDDNYIFWQDKLQRCSLDIPGGMPALEHDVD